MSVSNLVLYWLLILNLNLMLNHFEISPLTINLILVFLNFFSEQVTHIRQRRSDTPRHVLGPPDQDARDAWVGGAYGVDRLILALDKFSPLDVLDHPETWSTSAQVGVGGEQGQTGLGVLAGDHPVVGGKLVVVVHLVLEEKLLCEDVSDYLFSYLLFLGWGF